MDRQLLSSKLIDLTGSLLPSPNASITDLQDVRRSLAFSLSREQPETRDLRSLAETFNQAPIEQIESSVVSELQEIADQTINQLKERPTESPEFRIFRRELPILTSQDSTSVPPWAAGLAIERTIGPFMDLSGIPVWFDFYRITPQVQVVRLPGAQPFLLLPLRGLLIQNSASYSLPRGSIWIASQLLTPSAPAGAYTGLRILGGTFSLSTSATVTAGVLQVASGVTCTLTIQIEQPETSGTIFGPGVDASNVNIQLPAEVTFVFSPTSASIIAAADALARLYGTEIQLQKGTEAPVYEPALNQILIPYGVTPDLFEIVECRSNLFQVSGIAPIKGGAWALPVAISDPIDLGEASGAGAMVVIVEPGLQGQWQGLTGNPVKLNNAFLMIEPGLLVVVAMEAKNSHANQTFSLWRESSDNSPRNSSVEVLYEKPIAIRYSSQQTGIEGLITTTGTAVAHLDRPLQADGSRLRIRIPNVFNLLYEDQNGIYVRLRGFIPEVVGSVFIPKPKIALALSNALLNTTPVKTLILFGKLQPNNQLENGGLRLNFGLYLLLPTLPDPYAANISIFRGRDRTDRITAILSTTVQWDVPEVSRLSFAFAPLPEMSVTASLAELQGGKEFSSFGQNITAPNQGQSLNRLSERGREEIENDRQETQNLREQFDQTLGSVQEQFFLLDVSSNADLLGVGVGFSNHRDVQTNSFPVQINGVDLVTEGQNVRIFTVPEIQWEPVRTIQNSNVKPFPFPSPLLSADDGGSTLIGVNTVNLVPIAPRPVLEQIVSEFNSDTDSKLVAALFTLPFGMKAIARLKKVNFDQIQDDILPLRGSELALNQPNFPDRNLIGGLQLSAIATLNPLFKEFVEESPYLKGATIQLRNGVDRTGVPFVDDNGVPLSVLGPAVDVIFNQEFAPTGKNPRVPITRIDFSGYGASMFSNWSNPDADPPATVKVRFDVMVGRTAYEVIQVKSVVFPCCAVFVRTITIQRTNSGGVVRSDSGWVSATPGVYKYPGLTFHPGVVKGFFNIRNIRDTAQVYEVDYGSNGVLKLAAVYFDADVQIDDPIRGAANGLVSSPNQLGFVLLSLPKSQTYLQPVQLAELLKSQGSLGGSVDCVVDVGKAGQHMRVTRVDFSTALTLGGNPIFAGGARGSLVLPRDGAWSITRKTADEHQALDPDFGVPLVREGEASVVLNPAYNNPNPLRFADPADLLRSNNPTSDYGLLFSTDTQRLLFPRPKIETGSRKITSTERPLLADMYALMTAVGIFPKASNCIPIPTNNFALETQAGGGFKLVLPFPDNKFAVTPFTRNIANSPPVRTYAEYADDRGNQTEITIKIDSLASPVWSIKMSPVSVVLDFDPFEKLMRTVGAIEGQAGVPTQLSNPSIVYGSVLSPLQEIITILKDFGLPIPMQVSMSNAGSDNKKYKLTTSLGFKKKGIDTGFGKLNLKFVSKLKVGLGRQSSQDPFYIKFVVKASGDIQQAIIPPLVYGGGLLELEIGISDDGQKTKPSIKLAAGVVGSVGGSIIKKLVKLEATIKRGYFIAFEDKTIKPGVLLSISGEAGVLDLSEIPGLPVSLGSLIGIGFEAEAKGTIARLPNDMVELKAGLTLAINISLAWVFEIETELETEYKEELPLAVVAGLGAALALSGAPLVTL
jgi:hypothetical protein